MDKLKELFSLDPAAMLPELPGLLEKLVPLCRWAVMIVPLLVLILGLVYLFLAPKEANHELGWRCWWGMSTPEVWRFSQKLAGLAWSGMGLIMSAVMFFVGLGYRRAAPEEALLRAVKALAWEVGLVIVSILVIDLILIILFDAKGNVRREKQK